MLICHAGPAVVHVIGVLDLGSLGVICMRLEIYQIKQKHKSILANFSVENIYFTVAICPQLLLQVVPTLLCG